MNGGVNPWTVPKPSAIRRGVPWTVASRQVHRGMSGLQQEGRHGGG